MNTVQQTACEDNFMCLCISSVMVCLKGYTLGMGNIDILVHDYFNANISRLPRLLI